jgi:flavin-dependent dehydrogenase
MPGASPVIIGAGPAGSAAAIHLAGRGEHPLLLERTADDADPLCGGFLSWRTVDRLAALDLDTAMLGGRRIDHVAIFTGRSVVRAALPAPGLALSRRRLDRLMRARAEASGAILRRGVAVRAIEEGAVRLADGERIGGSTVFLATGKRDLHGFARTASATPDPEVGLRLRLPVDEARTALIGSAIELHLFADGYLGFIVQEDGSANACMAVRKRLLGEAGGDARALVAMLGARSEALAERLSGLDLATADAVGPVPYGWVARETRPGLFRIGDQAACIPSLAGEGIGIALASAEQAVAAWAIPGSESALRYQQAFARKARRPLRMASMARTLAASTSPVRAIMPALVRLPGLVNLLGRLTRV